MSDHLRDKMESKTARHAASFEEALQYANAKGRAGAEKAVRELYGLFSDAIPRIPEVTVSENNTAMGLPSISFRFYRADGERHLVLTPIRYLDPREWFPEGPFSRSSPYAVLGMEIESNAWQVQIGYLTLELTARTLAELWADQPRMQWEVNHLVNEARPEVDKALVRRLIERAFVQDDHGNT